jgi:hypothetical protein
MSAPDREVGRSGFSGSYRAEDVTFLLKPVQVLATDVDEKERMIQSGRRHYSEMIAPESPPEAEYLRLYRLALERNGRRLAGDIAALAAALAGRRRTGEVVIASLARAGTPVGVLLRRALLRLGVEARHYSISIIRDRGIDLEALAYIASRHAAGDVVFVDGWTGKGTIAGELRRSLAERPFGIDPFLAVVADPAGRADLAATEEDYLIPSGILNAVVSGLVSRSILNEDLVGAGDFHACRYYSEFAADDLSRSFVDTIDALAPADLPPPLVRCPTRRAETARRCDSQIGALMARFGIGDRNRVKPGIAEATRAILRRLPERLLIRHPDDPDVSHLVYLAREKGLTVDELPEDHLFRAVAVIRGLGLSE